MNDAMQQIGLTLMDLRQTMSLLDAATARFSQTNF